MMKQKYISPTLRIVPLRTRGHLLAGSPMGFGGNATKETTVDSRRNSFWDDEEDY